MDIPVISSFSLLLSSFYMGMSTGKEGVVDVVPIECL